MFSQVCVTHSVQLGGGGGGEVTPDASWDRSHGHGGGGPVLGGGVNHSPWVKGQPPPPGSKVNHLPYQGQRLTTPPPSRMHTELRSMGRRYVSYWNAYLCYIISVSVGTFQFFSNIQTEFIHHAFIITCSKSGKSFGNVLFKLAGLTNFIVPKTFLE